MCALTRIKNEDTVNIGIKIGDAVFPSPFSSGLEYSSPARGTWNIVHTGMLIPETHQIFVCAQGCLRGVVLTAAEMGVSERFSTIAVQEENILSGNNEELIIEGVTDILNKLAKKPRAVLVYTSCLHHFIGCDLSVCYAELRRRFPDIKFTDCYMNPIMRKSGLTPDAKMRVRLYSLLDKTEKNPQIVTIAGGDFATDKESELYKILESGGYTIREVASTKTFDEYLKISEASLCITTFPAAIPSGKELRKVHEMKHIHLPFSFGYDEIYENYNLLCENLGLNTPDFSKNIERCDTELLKLREYIGNTPIVIDYTAFTRPLSLALLLLSKGFNVTKIFADSFTFEEEKDFENLKSLYPEILIYPTVHSSMRVIERKSGEKTIAIGQKAAYFCDTRHFVNIVENGGRYGFESILKLCRDIKDAYDTEKDTKNLIQIKGMGCSCGI